MRIKAPSAAWSAWFFVVVTVASLFVERATLAEVFRHVSVVAAFIATVAAWLVKAWEEYRRGRWPEEEMVHTMDRGSARRGFWSRWLWG